MQTPMRTAGWAVWCTRGIWAAVNVWWAYPQHALTAWMGASLIGVLALNPAVSFLFGLGDGREGRPIRALLSLGMLLLAWAASDASFWLPLMGPNSPELRFLRLGSADILVGSLVKALNLYAALVAATMAAGFYVGRRNARRVPLRSPNRPLVTDSLECSQPGDADSGTEGERGDTAA